MASQTDEAERRVREQRALIERKVTDLERRVGDDLTIARERVAHHVAHLPDMVPGGSRVMEEAQEHPLAAIASSVGLGVVLGMVTGGDSEGSRGRREGGSGRANGRSPLGAAGGMLSGLGATMMSPLRPYMEDMARDVFEGFTDRRRQSASSAARDESRQASQERD
ncbi:MAG: hypothetical protein M0R73_02750 [Dehalococcoidia bacterium]|nr:hypothetical protein [Dehalococcoidia bacterium]